MTSLHVPFTFYPDPVGGTEVYVEALARQLQARGHPAVIAAPASRDATYTHEGLTVYRFAVPAEPADAAESYGPGDPEAARRFAAVLEAIHPDLLHLHAFTRGVSLRLVQEAKRQRLPVIFTYHTPTVSCQRGTLLQWGTTPCDGRLDERLCTQCTLHGLGLPRAVAQGVGLIHPWVSDRFLGVRRLGRAGTALRLRGFVRSRHATVRALFQEADRLVAVAQWVWDLLVLNGVPPEKLLLCRHGLAQAAPPASPTPTSPGRPLRVAFLGRLDPTKGAHLLVRAFRMAPALTATLDLYGIVQHESERAYRQELERLAAGDRRIHFHDALPPQQVIPTLQRHHLLAIPSQWLESGPLVVLEAFAAGIPVLGSRRGGIAELVQHGVNGLLVEAGDVAAWQEALRTLCADPALQARLRAGVRPPRTMAEVAQEMEAVYHTLLPRAAT